MRYAVANRISYVYNPYLEKDMGGFGSESIEACAMYDGREGHFESVERSVLLFLHRSTDTYLSLDGYQLHNVKCAAEGCTFVLNASNKVSAAKPVYTCENCTKGKIPCNFYFCGDCFHRTFSEQDKRGGQVNVRALVGQTGENPKGTSCNCVWSV